ncbi:MAG: C40 family peptidase [Firmicutes bacterium]|nr:C40 family peptidase [Bacillota bacterium]
MLSAAQEKLNQIGKNITEVGNILGAADEATKAAILQVAKSFVKQIIPYGHSPRPFDKDNKDRMMDCSELTYRVYKQALGIDIPQTADAQYQFFKGNYSIITDPLGAQVGDIVFFTEPGANKITHVGIVSAVNNKGEIKYIHSPRKDHTVEEKQKWLNMATSSYYSTHFVAFGRL